MTANITIITTTAIIIAIVLLLVCFIVYFIDLPVDESWKLGVLNVKILQSV